MKKQTNLISQNLSALRQYHKYSQEEVAEKVGVTRQAVAKWEAGETVPDIEYLRTNEDTGLLSLEEIMLRTEGSDLDETAL